VLNKLNLDQGEQADAAAYQAAIDFLYSRINYEKGHASYSASNYRLDRMRRLLDLLGNPQNGYRIVHVAGTKGKGTTSHAIACLLNACGFRVGVYTSPHLLRLEERIQCLGHHCSARELVGLVDRMRHVADVLEAEGSGRPTFFELTTAMGMLHFADIACDYVVLEVGLGGRLDSTNVCHPEVSVITSISLDHQAQLGSTIAAIAGEKAGIIKREVPVVSTARHPEARQVIAQMALEQGAPLYWIDRDFSVDWRPLLSEHEGAPAGPLARAEVDYRTRLPNSWIGDGQWRLPLLGRHQADNLAGALTVLDLLAATPAWPRVPIPALQTAILELNVPARVQVVGHAPLQIIDTAHNPASIAATLDALDVHFPSAPRTIVFASSRDKDFEEMLEILLTRCQRVVLTTYQNNVRGLPLADLHLAAQAIAAKLCASSAAGPIAQILLAPSAAAGWRLAKQSAGLRDIVCGTGSFFLAAELLAIIAE
jgi:dihydrofolate synthase/folylpolyglutamate synthase